MRAAGQTITRAAARAGLFSISRINSVSRKGRRIIGAESSDEHRRIFQGAVRPHARRHGLVCRMRRSAGIITLVSRRGEARVDAVG
jgi:ribosomal protein L34